MLMEKLIKTSKSSRMMLSGCFIAIVGIFAYNWTVAPHLSYLHASQDYQEMIGRTSEKVEVVKQRIQNKEKELADLKEEIAKTEDYFFTSKKAREFFSDLDPVSLQCNCTIISQSSVPPQPISSQANPDKNSSITQESITLSLKGKYKNLLEFMNRLGSYKQRISISNLLIEIYNAKSKELICYMTVTIYVINDKEIIND